MNTLVMGASGETGRLLVDQLVNAGQKVKIIVRSPDKLPENWIRNNMITVVHAGIAKIKINEMAELIRDCQAVACCLGHNLTIKGIFGPPRKLVTNAVQLTCKAILQNAPEKPVKFVLMNTAGNRNRDLNESESTGEKIVSLLLRLILPPHLDNEKAADYLRVKVGKNNPVIEWTAVRPDNLINEKEVSGYSLHISPTRSPIFNPGETSRINVGHFMANLITNQNIWNKWKGNMPVIYNT
ncbi:NAD(P)-dependent oxidoreductase [Membranihabitans maritimus]|uniref:NAD(P)-dependent oxidoreductase n=1 Tax=Membranihabitans maritimus TaxID=2904244 RepID=UPI001F2445DF|nr:NAD(P)-binding oxidoreductase [Membranihabitans maritimus]